MEPMKQRDEGSSLGALLRGARDLFLALLFGTSVRDLRRDVGPEWMHRLERWLALRPRWLRATLSVVIALGLLLGLLLAVAVIVILLSALGVE